MVTIQWRTLLLPKGWGVHAGGNTLSTTSSPDSASAEHHIRQWRCWEWHLGSPVSMPPREGAQPQAAGWAHRALSWLTSLLQRSAREGYHSLGRWKLLGAINGFFPGCPQEWNCKPSMTMKGVAHDQKIMLKYLSCLYHPQCLELSPFPFSSHTILEVSPSSSVLA